MRFVGTSIETPRFLLRSLTLSDATQAYLSWMKEASVAKYIAAAPGTQSIESLQAYILEKSTKEDCLFLGIFEKKQQYTHREYKI